MEIKIEEINNKELWEGFISGCEEKSFLQSWNWGEFQKMLGEKIWRFGIFEGNQLISVALVTEIKAKRGTFLFVPHGPVIKYQVSPHQSKLGAGQASIKYQVLGVLLEELKKIAEKEKAIFIRIAPIWERSEENKKVFKDLGFREAPIHMHPEITWELDIAVPEEEILMAMRKTTRYLIRQAQKNKEIKIIQSQNLEDIETFNQLYQQTVKRHNFVPFSSKYLKNEFLAFKDDNQVSVLLGSYKNEVLSSAIVIFYSGIGFYHQGASSLKYPKIPVSYLLQWEAIKEAERRGCQTYNFWGIAEGKSKIRKHPWAGLTLFKMGFGGYKKEYVKTQDLPLSATYWLTCIFEKIRKIKRGL